MQHKSNTLDELRKKGLIKESDRDALYDRLLKEQKEKVKKKDAKIRGIIEKMKENNISLSDFQKDFRISH